MRIGVIDGACRSLGGHHLTSLQVIARALPGLRPVFHIHRDADPRIATLLGEVRFDFTGDPYRPTAQRQRKARRGWLWHVYQLSRRLRGRPADVIDGSCHRSDLAAILHHYGPGDHLVLPTTRLDMLSSLLDVVGEQSAASLPRLHLRFLEYADEPDRELAERSFGRLADLVSGGAPVHLYCETDTLRRFLGDSFGLRPIDPCLLQPPAADPALRDTLRGEDAALRVGFLGGSRRDKGFYRLPAIARATFSELASGPAPPLRFVVQVSGGGPEDWLRRQLAAGDGLSEGQFELVPGPLDDRSFSALLAGCDILLLPYSDRNSCRCIGSGLLIDARINGVPVVCTPQRTLEEFISPDTGLTAESDRDFGRCIVTIARDIDRFRSAAAREADHYRDLWQTNRLVTRLREA